MICYHGNVQDYSLTRLAGTQATSMKKNCQSILYIYRHVYIYKEKIVYLAMLEFLVYYSRIESCYLNTVHLVLPSLIMGHSRQENYLNGWQHRL